MKLSKGDSSVPKPLIAPHQLNLATLIVCILEYSIEIHVLTVAWSCGAEHARSVPLRILFIPAYWWSLIMSSLTVGYIQINGLSCNDTAPRKGEVTSCMFRDLHSFPTEHKAQNNGCKAKNGCYAHLKNAYSSRFTTVLLYPRLRRFVFLVLT